jgi:CheY-like chemotaxis protein
MPAPTSVLVLDDDRDTADTFGELLRMLGYVVLVAYSGAQALEVAAPVKDLAVAVLDLEMREVSGYAVAAQLARRPNPPRLIAMSGVLRPDLAELQLDSYLVKPARIASLRAAVGAAAARWWYLRDKVVAAGATS